MGSSSTLSSAHSSASSIELDADDAKFNGNVCHIHFSDGGSTTIALKSGVPARSLLNNVASRRGLSPGCIDWLLLNEGSNTDSLSLDADSMCLSGRHIRGELRVTFRLDIVHIKRSIGIRSKIHKPVSEVLQPIMARYIPDRTLSQVVVRLAGTKLPVNMMDPVSTLKEQRVVLELKENEFRKPVEPKRPKSDVQQSALDLLRRRRDSLGIRKRSRSRESGLNRISAVNIGIEESQDSNKAKADFDNRLSLGGQGQLQNISQRLTIYEAGINKSEDQRGLLNKNDLILPDFLRPAENADKENNKDNFDLDARIPTHEEADELFGGSIGDGPDGSHGLDGAFGGSSISLAFTETSSCSSSILRDSTNDLPIPVERKRLQKLSTSEDSNGNEHLASGNSAEIVRKRTSLTQADLIDLPSPPKAKKSNAPQTTVV
ncbi:Oidioi.mRNA.OKI2018_I69.PAR.g11476.t2.cds [Oikopleura dioica]|uniref:Oidioi.mRNA.OKI2018_I69.PAR.g11476.t2.cds n=1 Tax=Oikopleura dioica TaxID=34765 RepID=A0ABN7RVU4_OIKDI|nr:Oidioi.mRNA.OKI2018_I69.PAR.g11476.t2.cds [Oikopleura dioica]